MRKLSFKQFIQETAYLPPEAFTDDRFMDAWCDKYFGIRYDEELIPKEKVAT